MKVQYISQVISEEERKGFRKGETVAILATVGAGKTTFSMDMSESFLEKGQSVLILVPRKLLKNQYQKALLDLFTTNAESSEEWFLNVEVRTYQEIEHQMLMNGGEIRKYYDLVIADEFHYFMDDALFNAHTIFSYDFLNKQKCALRVLLSGTGEKMHNFMIADQGLSCYDQTAPKEPGLNVVLRGGAGKLMWKYTLQTSYDDLVVNYLRSKSEILPFLACATGKSLVFVESKKQGEALQLELEKLGICARFLNAENKEGEAKECVEMLELRRKFKENVLISTSVLDAGVSLEDAEIRNVVIDQMEKNTFLQMLGRVRRMMGSYHFELYLVGKAENEIERRIVQSDIKRTIFTVYRYRKRYESEEGIICPQWKVREIAKSSDQAETAKDISIFDRVLYSYDGQQRVNKLLLAKIKFDYEIFCEYLDAIEKNPNGYLITQLRWIGKQYNKENWVWKRKIQELDDFISQFWVEQRLFMNRVILKGKKNQRFFLDRITPYVQFIDSGFVNNGVVSMKNFNLFCGKYNLNWTLENYIDNKVTMYELISTVPRSLDRNPSLIELIRAINTYDQNDERENNNNVNEEE